MKLIVKSIAFSSFPSENDSAKFIFDVFHLMSFQSMKSTKLWMNFPLLALHVLKRKNKIISVRTNGYKSYKFEFSQNKSKKIKVPAMQDVHIILGFDFRPQIRNMHIKRKTYNLFKIFGICQSLSSEGPKHVLGGTKDVSAATIYRTCFGPSELQKLWHFLYFVFDFCTKIHNAIIFSSFKICISHLGSRGSTWD
ncbi:hypothetical protein BpHYR1_024022 [Brachionus plicatilis]|uniref:Uncharacterized protein n=1 Tax=Brachionus plicatilis TaxID=10195 RepID=A0A3M7SIM3_BRAPC|nr:hypothetical protein BpHYR1_024022 [Brachionus plicatilis]